ncbi:MAG: FAD-binding oxidoreductase [Bacteroidia bacterium]|nr:FAD-binding oxidoreductase [Bacteroidia bacterium]
MSSGNFSFWEQRWMERADQVVIGGGLVGLQTAIELKLKYPHKAVWVLERNAFGDAASLRNAGFACFGSAGEILDDISRMGEDQAFQLYEERYKGLQDLIRTYTPEKIGYEQSGGYEIFPSGSEAELNHIRENLLKLNDSLREVHQQVSFVERNIKKFEMNVGETAIVSPSEGAIQSHLLLRTVRQHALSVGVEIYTSMNVKSIEKHGSGGWMLEFEHSDAQILAKDLFICTNAWALKWFPDLELEPARGQILVTNPIPSIAFRGIFHADQGYIYFRSLGSRILIGGARNTQFKAENTFESAVTPEIKSELLRWLNEIIVPGIHVEIDTEWSGVMGMHQKRSPIIERKEEHLYLGVRMGGMGVALSSQVAKKLVKLTDL